MFCWRPKGVAKKEFDEPSDPLFALHPTPVAPNVTRIVVEGSDKGRTEYLKLTIDTRGGSYPFSWVRVPLP